MTAGTAAAPRWAGPSLVSWRCWQRGRYCDRGARRFRQHENTPREICGQTPGRIPARERRLVEDLGMVTLERAEVAGRCGFHALGDQRQECNRDGLMERLRLAGLGGDGTQGPGEEPHALGEVVA